MIYRLLSASAAPCLALALLLSPAPGGAQVPPPAAAEAATSAPAEGAPPATDPAASGESPPAAPAEAPAPPPPPPEPLWIAAGLADQASERVDLLVSEQPIPALLRPVEGSVVRGGVVLLHDLGAHPEWPGVIGPLRRSLPRYGWATIAPALPAAFSPPPPREQPPPPPPPAAEGEAGADPAAAGEKPAEAPPTEPPPAEEKPPEQANGDEAATAEETPPPPPPPPYQPGPWVAVPAQPTTTEFLDGAQERIAAALSELASRGIQPVVLVGHGLGAVAALAYAVDHPGAVQGLVLVGLPSRSGDDPRLDSAAQLALVKLPVLDIFGDDDQPAVTATAEHRAALAARSLLPAPPTYGARGIALDAPPAGTPLYRQLAVEGADHQFRDQSPLLVKRVRGWLHRHADASNRSSALPQPTSAGVTSP